MTATIAVSSAHIEELRARADAEFGVYYEGVAASSVAGKTAAHEAAVKKQGGVFGSTYTAINKAITQRAEFSRALGSLQPTYAAYVAAAALSDGSRPQLSQPFAQTLTNALVSGNFMRTTLEGLLHAYVQKGATAPVTNLYFGGVAHEASKRIANDLPYAIHTQLKQLRWKIQNQEIPGMPSVGHSASYAAATNEEIRSNQSQPTGVQNDLQRITFSKGRVLRRDQIIGDTQLLTELERQAQNLSFYDLRAQANPLKAAGLFTNRHTLQGPPGTGKTEVIFYIANYAYQSAKKAGLPVEIVRLNFDSAWQDGGIISAQAQLQQISNGDKVYIVVQDELGSLFSKRATPDTASTKIEKEFLRFANGEYPDRGNYLLLGTVNDITDIPAPVVRAGRMRISHWAGPQSAADLGRLLQTKLVRSVNPQLLPVAQREYTSLGTLAQTYQLSGADMTAIAESAKEQSLDWNRIETTARTGTFSARLEAVRNAYNPITASVLTQALYAHVESRTRSRESSEEQNR